MIGAPLGTVLSKLGPVKKSGAGYMATCPAHDDGTASLCVSEGDDGRVLLCCQAGCTAEDVLARLELGWVDLFPPKSSNGKGAKSKAVIADTYDYVDEAGALLFQVVRMVPKSFQQRRPDGHGGWLWKLNGTRRVLYKLPDVVAAVKAARTIYVVEGEKDVAALERAGQVATCNPGGAGKWSKVPDAAKVLAGANVIVVADKDAPGRKHADEIAADLRRHGCDVNGENPCTVTIVEALEGKDAADHLAAGHGVDDFVIEARGDREITPSVDPPGEPSRFTPDAVPATVQPPPPLAYTATILDAFAGALHGCGVVGEDRNAKLVYLALTSRLLDEPISLAVKGLSSSGKSYTVETVLKFFPEAAYIAMTAMSERALIYMKEDFAHKTLVLFEAVALREQREKTDSNLTAYFVRSLLSEGRIRYPVTVRDKDGNFVTKTIVKNGPTNMILTTTATSLHGENETRMLSLPTNDSRDQTRAVLAQLAKRSTAPDLSDWLELQSWLVEGADRRAVVPFAACIATKVPPVAVRLRRDFRSLLRLVETHALLHQATRNTDGHGRVVATIDDYSAVRELIADLLSDAVGATVSETARETVETVGRLAGPEGITSIKVADALKLDKSAAYRRLQAVKERGFITNLEDRRGRPGRYVLGDSLPDAVELLPAQPCNPGCNHQPDETAGQADGCTVARTAEGKERNALVILDPDDATTCSVCDTACRTLYDGIAVHPNCADQAVTA